MGWKFDWVQDLPLRVKIKLIQGVSLDGGEKLTEYKTYPLEWKLSEYNAYPLIRVKFD